MRLPRSVCIVSVLIAASIVGMLIRNAMLTDKINKLAAEKYELEQTLLSTISDASLANRNFKDDEAYFELMFTQLFTFYDIDDFDEAKLVAQDYKLPKSFIASFYDKTELVESAYAEAMLDVVCKYDSAEYFLIDATDDARLYMIHVRLDMVTYNSFVDLMFFIELTDDTESRVNSMIYYTL